MSAQLDWKKKRQLIQYLTHNTVDPKYFTARTEEKKKVKKGPENKNGKGTWSQPIKTTQTYRDLRGNT